MFRERRSLSLWFFDRSKIGISGLLASTSSHLVAVLGGLQGAHILCLFKAILDDFAVPPVNLEGICVAKAPLCLSETSPCVPARPRGSLGLFSRSGFAESEASRVPVAGQRRCHRCRGGGGGRGPSSWRSPGAGVAPPGPGLCAARPSLAFGALLPHQLFLLLPPMSGGPGWPRSASLSAGDAHVAAQRRPAPHGIWCLDSSEMQNYSAANAQ